jgi:hypothetical protein
MELVFIEEQIQPLQNIGIKTKLTYNILKMNDVNMLWNGQAPCPLC